MERKRVPIPYVLVVPSETGTSSPIRLELRRRKGKACLDRCTGFTTTLARKGVLLLTSLHKFKRAASPTFCASTGC